MAAAKKPAMKVAPTVDAYIAGFPADVPLALSRCAKRSEPQRPPHIGLYPMLRGSAADEKKLAPYRAAKATARLPLGTPIPVGVVKKIVAVRLKERRTAAT